MLEKQKDLLADPKGEYLSAYYASEVYRLYGLKGLDSPAPPAVEQPIRGRHIGYHIRNGIRDILLYDWLLFMDFADFHFFSVQADSFGVKYRNFLPSEFMDNQSCFR